jgi:hypothetical protein
VSPDRKVPVRKGNTAAEMIKQGGWYNFRSCLKFVSRYAKACDELGHLITVGEYRNWSGVSRAQAYKDLAAWRACMGDVSVLEVLPEGGKWLARGWTEEQRRDAIALFWMDTEAPGV